MKSRTSGLIRGIQLAERFGWKFYEQGDNRILSERNEKIIFIRSIDKNLAKTLRNLGNHVGFDLLDRPVADQHSLVLQGSKNKITWESYRYDIDFYIVNNTLTKNCLEIEGNVKQPIYVIPHHTVNFESKKISFNENVKKVGYIGLEDQFSHKDEILNHLRSRNIDFYMCHPLSRESVVDALLNIDIGIISIENENSSLWKDYILNFKPNTKLSNFQSFGIPTIASSYASFSEFGENCWINANSKKEFINSLDLLIDDPNKRRQLSITGEIVGKNFHIDNIFNAYNRILQ